MVEGSDRCLELSFTGGTLDAGQEADIQVAINKSNWTSYDKSNDYSYNKPENVKVVL